jgi:hypothetical protein
MQQGACCGGLHDADLSRLFPPGDMQVGEESAGSHVLSDDLATWRDDEVCYTPLFIVVSMRLDQGDADPLPEPRIRAADKTVV